MIGGIVVLLIYITRLASNEIFSPSNKIHWEVGWAKDLSVQMMHAFQAPCFKEFMSRMSGLHCILSGFCGKICINR